jgi:hypothetical protein
MATTMSYEGRTSDVADLLSRIQCLASTTGRIEDDQTIRAQILQLSRELIATLQQPDEVVSLVAFSVRKKHIGSNESVPTDRSRATATCA